MNRRLAIIIAVFAVAACSSGGGTSNPGPGPTSAAKPSQVAAIGLALGGTLTPGSASVVPLTVQAIGTNGAVITGTFLSTVGVVSTDPNDVKLSSSSSGANPSAAIDLTSGGQPVYLVYDGNTLPAGTSITAATTTASAVTLTLAAAASSTASAAPSSQPTVATSYLNAIYVTGSGASPVNSGGGAIPIFIIAQDQNGNDITGAFPSPIGVTLTDACDESLSINTSVTVTPCAASGGIISNIAALTVTSASQVVFVNYDAHAAASTTAQSSISISTSSVVAGASSSTTISIFCDAISFPYNVTETCEPAATPGPTGPLPVSSPFFVRHH